MQLDGIFPFTDAFLAICVRQRQDAVFIGIGTEVFNGVARKPEAIGAVRVEGHFRATIITGDDSTFFGRLGCLFCFLLRRHFFFDRLFFFRFFRSIGRAVCLNAASGKRPDGFRGEVKNLRILRGIIGSVCIIPADIHADSALHLHGIGICLHYEDSMFRNSSCNRAILIHNIGAFGSKVNVLSKAGFISYLCSLAVFNAIRFGSKLIAAGSVKIQLQIYIESRIVLENSTEIRTEELVILHLVEILIHLVETDGESALRRSLAVGFNLIAGDRPCSFRNKAQYAGILGAVIRAVFTVAFHVHVGGTLHLFGIGVGFHLIDSVGRNRGSDGDVIINGIGALSRCKTDHTEAGAVILHGTLAVFNHVGIRGKGVVACSVKIQLQIYRKAGIIYEEAAEVGALELIILHLVQIFVSGIEADGICAFNSICLACGCLTARSRNCIL